jgi:hypothetical protein
MRTARMVSRLEANELEAMMARYDAMRCDTMRPAGSRDVECWEIWYRVDVDGR